MTKQLFDKTISSIAYDQNEMLRDIKELFLDGKQFQLDACFGYGNFYPDRDYPELRFDLINRYTGENRKLDPCVSIASAAALPLESASVASAIWDPPFVVTSHVESEEYVMGEKYGGYKTITELRAAYYAMLIEHYRVLARGGWLVIKCQNFIHGKKSYFIRNEIHNWCTAMGFKAIDEFILLSKNRFTGKVHKQRHARKFHSYFLVLQK